MLDASDLIKDQRDFFQSGETLPASFRLNQLQRLRASIVRYEAELTEALSQDLHKSQFESYATEIGFILAEIRHAIRHLRSWMKPKKARTPLTHFGSSSRIHYEPYGVALVIAPWNYPINLAIAPLVASIAAGNCAVIKPSELAPHTSKLLAEIIRETFPPQYITVVEGDVETSTALLDQKFDYIFFTGSSQVGKVVMTAAVKHLTPVTLELGGKSPCIVHADVNVKLAAKRIVWGKFLNAGQTCIAPDYLFVHRNVKDKLIEQMKYYITQFYGDQPGESEEYTHIINEDHFRRLKTYLSEGRVLFGGHSDSTALVIEPTLLDPISWDTRVMQEEIFGPILPIISYDSISDVINWIQTGPKPLALYLFTNDQQIQQQVVRHVSYGGGCINDTVFHIAQPNLPFGGVGDSGIGGYHGRHGFELFSHKKSVVKQTTKFDLPFRYHTNKEALKRIKWFLR